MTTEQSIPISIFTQSVVLTRTTLSFCEPNTHSLKTWIYTVSNAPAGNRSKALLNALIELSELSELDVTPSVKFNLVQTIHYSIDQMIEYLKSLVKEQLTFSFLHKENILDLIESFRCYMARLYFDIFLSLREQTAQRVLSITQYFSKKKQNILSWYACYLSLEQLSLLTCHQHMLYREALKGQWQQTHHLYLMACQHQYENIEIYYLKDCIASQSDLYTIATLYKQILLLHLLNTQQVRPNETYALYQCSAEWAYLLRVTSKKDALSRYMIQPQTDEPPITLTEYPKNANHQNYFYINVNALFKRIQLANAPNQRHLSAKEQRYLNNSLIFHITNTLNQSPERRYERYNFNSSIQVCFGLKSVHYRLSHTILKHQHTLEKQAKQFNFQHELLHLAPKNDIPTVNLDFDENIYMCSILDVSVNGYRMQWRGEIPKHLHAGEFLAVQENNQSPWRCGLIRWIKQLPNKDIEFGVEIISQNITLCYIKQYNTLLEKHIYSPALLLKKDILDQSGFFLAMPTLDLPHQNNQLTLYITSQTVPVYVTHKELENPSFILCNFDLLTLEDQHKFNYLISQYDKLLKNLDV